MREISITIPFDQRQLENLRLLSKQTKAPMTVYTPEGIARVLDLCTWGAKG
jgi:hypothetical protein